MHSDVPAGRVAIVPNSFIFKSKVFNYSDMHPFIWEKVDLVLQFESPMQVVREMFDRALREESTAEFKAVRMRLAYVTVRQPPENSALHAATGAARA